MCTEYKVDKRIAAVYLISYMLLLHHTTAKGYNKMRIILFVFFHGSNVSENSVLGVFAHGTGIIKD